jgi:hypothetical protein
MSEVRKYFFNRHLCGGARCQFPRDGWVIPSKKKKKREMQEKENAIHFVLQKTEKVTK